MIELDRSQLRAVCERACRGAGATPPQAELLAEATVEAELRGRRPVGVSHLLDYLGGFHDGRITTDVAPSVEQPTPVVVRVDCHGGLAQHGFDVAAEALVGAADTYGLAVLAVESCFTVGELDHYTRRLNAAGLIGLTCANSPALMSVAGARSPVLGTNPLSFGVPLPDGRRLTVDQASSATAWVSVRDAANRGAQIPLGWAVGPDGSPTTSADEGLAGALLPFGGYKGGNIALMVEVLATLAGGRFSSAAPPFNEGAHSPSVGMLVLALSPEVVGEGYPERLQAQLTAWHDDHGADVTVWIDPGEAPGCAVPDELYQTLMAWGRRADTST